MRTVTVSESTIHIQLPGIEFCLNTHKIYHQIQRIYAKEDVTAHLLDAGYSQQQVEALVDESFVEAYLKGKSNNETIGETSRLIAEDLAQELAAKCSTETSI